MPAEYVAHVLVCTNTQGAEDKRHCGDKSGLAIRQKFNELITQHKLIDKVTVSNAGCTSQHRLCSPAQGTVIIYGPGASGTWYVATPDDVEEIITKHLIEGKVVDRLLNKERSVKLA
jgi:NADH-quinone oxidoreductase subunit F